MTDTIFALSSGAPPAAIALIRISGPAASAALLALAGKLPAPRRASVADLRDCAGVVLDRALVLWLPGPRTATGEDCAELHLHGGRAVVRAVEAALGVLAGTRAALPGEFTRRAFANGRIDLSEAEGLADLLSAETELQRRAAMALLTASASLEAVLDFSDEDDVSALPPDFAERLGVLAAELSGWLERPRAETLREGFRVVLAGPPNAGKSTLFNALVEADAAITAPIPGTTRDVLSRPVAISGIPFVFEDTAGLRDETADVIEAIGIERARTALERADVVLWLGSEGEGPAGAWEIAAQIDRADHAHKVAPRHAVSVVTGQGIEVLRSDLVATARAAMPRPGEAALNARQHALLAEARSAIVEGMHLRDPLVAAECLRLARVAFDALIGRATTEDMLDALFGRFCIGK